MSDGLTLLPDVERLLVDFLLDQDEVTAIVDTRIYTELPANAKTWPAVRVNRYSGSPRIGRPLWLDEALVQVDCWGGPKATAHQLAETIRAALALRLPGSYDDAVVTGVDFGEFRDEADDTVPSDAGKARPRFLFTCTIFIHPQPTPGS